MFDAGTIQATRILTGSAHATPAGAKTESPSATAKARAHFSMLIRFPFLHRLWSVGIAPAPTRSRRASHEELVNRLMKLAERAKKAENNQTEAILNVPDEAVAKALDVAKQAI